MCGIVGYVGDEQCADLLVEGLRKLEYRGYDSAGVALLDESLVVVRAKGKLKNLEEKLKARAAARDLRASGTPAGRRTASPPTRTPIRTSTRGSRWCTTASSRTTSS